ncbi:MAG: purine-nucleoside phosphorylase [bacterium]|nr:purine-nucleoside phosphorylase [bacterium]
MTPHNEAKIGDIAKNVLMPGDPLRAKHIADTFLDDVKLVNTVRNMNAYTGKYKGKMVTIMPSGMGCASIGIYSYELFKFYDVDNIIRIGTAGSYSKDLDLYDLVLAEESYSLSSYAKIQGYDSNIIKSSEILNKKIIDVSNDKKVTKARIHTTDVFYFDEDISDLYNNKKCVCTEMESFALFYNALKLNKNATSILTISDNLVTNKRASIEERQTAFDDMIKIALDAIVNL